jgi:DNA-binding GntR family transcriptional regulator
MTSRSTKPESAARTTSSRRAERAPSSMATEVADAVRRQIQDGVLPPGEWLREPRICAEFEVGRAIARSALRILADDGLVRIEENRGAFVAATTAQEVFDIYELRAGLYGVAARFACMSTPADVMAETLRLTDILFEDTESGTTSPEELVRQSEVIFSRLASVASLDTQRMIEAVRRKTRWHYSYIGLAEGSGPPIAHWRVLRAGLAARDPAMAAEAARAIVHHTQNEVMRLMIVRGVGLRKLPEPAAAGSTQKRRAATT